MFDVFQNVFGKKKQTEPEKATEADEFVLIGNTDAIPDTSARKNDVPPPYPVVEPYIAMNSSGYPPPPTSFERQRSASEPSSLTTMTMQDVPFVLNTILTASAVVDSIWNSVIPCLNSITMPSSLQMEYDFSLENSVISETIK